MFGHGTSGEGCDAETLALPGRQRELAEAVLATGTPTVVVLLTGRPYALGGIADRAAAVVQGFFPGEEGGTADDGGIVAEDAVPVELEEALEDERHEVERPRPLRVSRELDPAPGSLDELR